MSTSVNAGIAFPKREPLVFFESTGEAFSHTGDTILTTIYTANIPGGTMGPNGALRIRTLWSNSGTGIRGVDIAFGGEAFFSNTFSVGTRELWTQLNNRNSESSQVSFDPLSSNFVTSLNAVKTATVDTTLDQLIEIKAQNITVPGDVITLEAITIEVLR